MVMFAFVLTPAPANFFFRSASWTTSFTRCGRPGPIWSIPTLKRSLIPLKRTGTGTTRKFRWALSVRRRRTTWERRTRRAARQLPLRRREKTSKRAQSWRRRERERRCFPECELQPRRKTIYERIKVKEMKLQTSKKHLWKPVVELCSQITSAKILTIKLNWQKMQNKWRFRDRF